MEAAKLGIETVLSVEESPDPSVSEMCDWLVDHGIF